MLLSDADIKEHVLKYKMIEPFVDGLMDEGVISYGLSSYGYDMRAGCEWKIFTDIHSDIIDPKKPSNKYFVNKLVAVGEQVIIPPNSYALTHSIETVCMPRDVTAICLGKSTYARVGLAINVTPLEAGWKGQVTIEVANSTRSPIAVYAGEGIMQVLFFKGDREPLVSYADRKGKYQNQKGVTLAIVK